MGADRGYVKSYKIEDAAGVGQFIAVVKGTANGGCKKPAGANAAGFLGFTVEAVGTQHKGVAVQKSGIGRAIAGGDIAYGDRLVIDGDTGKVKSEEAAIAGGAGTYAVFNVVGRAESSGVLNDVIPVWIEPESVTRAAS